MHYLEEESVQQNNPVCTCTVFYYAICYYEVFEKMLKKTLVWFMMLIKAEMHLQKNRRSVINVVFCMDILNVVVFIILVKLKF